MKLHKFRSGYCRPKISLQFDKFPELVGCLGVDKYLPFSPALIVELVDEDNNRRCFRRSSIMLTVADVVLANKTMVPRSIHPPLNKRITYNHGVVYNIKDFLPSLCAIFFIFKIRYYFIFLK